MPSNDLESQLKIIKRGAVEIISTEQLKAKLENSLKNNKPLVIKAGFDPTAADIHLGHTVLLRKLRQFQDLGHKVVFLIGDFTARIGDPTGRSEKRKQLSKEEVIAYAATYKKQVSKVLDLDRVEIVFNSDWFEKMSVLEILSLTGHATVAQMLARADFKKRLAKSEDISLLEFMYPLLQGYDSVKLRADIELGGTDQIFNLLVGRDMQKDYDQEQQVVITMPLLEGTDGVQKMSKSFGNYIGINDPPGEIFGKIMSISDELMYKYYELLTDCEISRIKQMHPKEAKIRLAKEIITQYHSGSAAQEAAGEFERVFSHKESPAEIPEYRLKANDNLVSILVNSGLVKSGNEARRLIKQGAVFFGEKKLEAEDFVPVQSGTLKAGSRRFLKIVI
ncbi:MAG: tyrosine--tRNA ligase [Candidatus Omnitrophica bacterium]|nr:tyrosine--tRNA ligase [Candidatus Omnitrophota bacterium]MDD5512234.1 tyrosine--tRNA ligase [Candidatus Omnitrophota bacterium]